VSGLVSGGPSTLWAIVRGDDLLAATLAAGALVVPDESSRRRLLLSAFAAHAILSTGWALVIAGVWPRRQLSPSAAITRGALCGAAIAALDLGAAHASTHLRLAGVRALPLAPQIADHVCYGAAVGVVLRRAQTSSMASAIESSTRPGR
jgi:hypothetical protein